MDWWNGWIEWWMDGRMDGWTDWLIAWLMDWLIHSFIVQSINWWMNEWIDRGRGKWKVWQSQLIYKNFKESIFLRWVYFTGPWDQFPVSWVFPGPLGQYLMLSITEFGVSEFSALLLVFSSFLSGIIHASFRFVYRVFVSFKFFPSVNHLFVLFLSFIVFTERHLNIVEHHQ